ncbi:MAG TPA: type II toxin-antitoxin system VapC family toxin [Cyclobacteriaceae bacterium]|nr:type II toxin-antitoxin system VapC family toxin [Cyclobacteriaceae bacterium]HMV10136.1 type II toxin-antitoxin system VapC family toxin [Cyclobacteriaceae bacterium]HMV90346.1 type II toxin-antitoxin system VapC family toxin [Cyclobacteriaceae bacterium]HMX00549.1 type II toxin-antitoxin system VapC family toxin [Cyclobacteriaceae bacterium]HMX49576.1 type II toxin-antitoxin system VapC family toxin [Cyclobacteriaceae bacterium]
MSKLLVDTNILIYSKDSSSVFHDFAERIITSDAKLFTTSKNLSEYYAVVTKGNSPLLSPLEALKDISEFVSVLEVWYPSPISHEKLMQLATKYQPKGLKIHDLEIAAICLVNGIDTIATVNKSDFQNIEGLTIVV